MIVDGYVRVSSVGGRSGESFLSPALQREQIERWVALHGALLAEVFVELEESGGSPDRPLLEAAVRRIELGHSGGLVVAYMSRFGRSMLHGLQTIQRISEAGGTFVSVQEGLDLSTDIGRHMLRQMLSWAEWELDRYRANWAAARERAVARGVWMPWRPFGYRRPPGGRLEPHPDEGPVVTELFHRRAAGATIAELRKELIEAGVPTATGKGKWRDSTVRNLLESRRYRGEVRHGEFFNPAGHEPLIDEATWRRAQQPHRADHFPRPLRGRDPALLSGILRCSGCRRLLWTTVAFRDASFEERIYHCGRADFAGECSAPVAIGAVTAEPYVEAVFWQELERRRRPAATKRVERMKQAVQRREDELDAYRDNKRLPAILGPERFAQGLAVRTRRLEQARVDLIRAEPTDDTPPLPRAAELRKRWASMGFDERRGLIAQVIEPVFVLRHRSRRESRLFICRSGSGPPDLPPRHAHHHIHTQPL